MNIADYARAGARTLDPATTQPERLANAALGLAGESGEIAEIIANAIDADDLVLLALQLALVCGRVCDAVKKARFHGTALGRGQFGLWLAELRDAAGLLAAIDEEPQPITFRAPLDAAHLAEEGGDASWHLLVQLCAGAGTDPAAMLAANIRKIDTRFPDGFTPAAANGRDTARERAALRGDGER